MVGAIFVLLIFSLIFLVFIFIFNRNNSGDKEEIYEEIRNPVVMQVLVPKENDKTPLAAEQMFASLHGLLGDRNRCEDVVSFEIVSTGEGGIRFYAVSPQHLAKFVEGQIYAQYPNADIKYVQDYTLKENSKGSYITTGEVEFVKDYIFPIKTFRDFEVDPLAAITGAISDLKLNESAWIQFLIRPVDNYWQQESKRYITAVREGKDLDADFWKKLGNLLSSMSKNLNTSKDQGGEKKEIVQLEPGQEEELRQIENKMLKVGFEFVIRIITKAENQVRSEQILRDSVASFKQFTTAHLNSFSYSLEERDAREIYQDYIDRRLPEDTIDIMNIEELASVFHMPNISVETPNIAWSRSKKLEPPMNLPTENDYGVSVFAETDYRERKIKFGIKPEDRRRHFYLLGKTGVGKSTVFKNMFIADVLRGEGACFVDPHGEAVEELLDFIPPERIDEIYWGDLERRYLKYEAKDLGDCPKCGAQLYPGYVYCPNCGEKIKRKCSKCGMYVDLEYKYCPYCGNQMIKRSQKEKEMSQEEMQKQIEETKDEVHETVKSKKSKYKQEQNFIRRVEESVVKGYGLLSKKIKGVFNKQK